MSPPGKPLESDLERLTANVLATAKYRHVAPELVSELGAAELAKRANLKQAIKATKNKLHQVAGAYQVGRPRYDVWLTSLRGASNAGQLKSVCAEIMAHHASTRERLPILDDFYATILADSGPIHSIVDLGCGLNPLSLPWMDLDPSTTYHAFDIYADQVEFLDGFFDLAGSAGQAQVWDLLRGAPPRAADVAFLFKVIPCLEQMDRSIGARLLDDVQARTIFVSFPAQSLGGRGKGMGDQYAAHFTELMRGRAWKVCCYQFDTEIFFRVEKGT